MRRRALRLLVLMLIVVALLLAGAQVVLWSNVPKGIVLAALREQTGLAIDADTLRTGWRGRTRVTNLTIGLPFEPDPFITVPSLDVDHSALLWIILTQSLDLHRVDITRPRVTIKPDAQDDWNLLLAADILTEQFRTTATDAGAPPRLPVLRIDSAHVSVASPDGSPIDYIPITVRGDPEGSMAWRFEATLGQRVDVNGRLAPRSAWSHEVHFDVQDIHALIEPWLPNAPSRLLVNGSWRGQVRQAGLSGRLNLADARADDLEAHGEVGVAVRGLAVTVTPSDLHVLFRDNSMLAAHVHRGSITLDPHSATLDRVQISTAVGEAEVTGELALGDRSGQLDVRLAGELLPYVLKHDGRARVAFEWPTVGAASLEGRVDWQAQSPWGLLTSAMRLDARGTPGRSVRATFTADTLGFTAQRGEVNLNGLTAAIHADGQTIRLSSLSVPNRRAHANGSIDLNSLEWRLSGSLRDWPLDPLAPGEAGLRLDAHGLADRVTLRDLTLSYDILELAVTGGHNPDDIVPLKLDAVLTADVPEDQGLPISGMLTTRSTVVGHPWPLMLDVTGTTESRGLRLRGRDVGSLGLTYTGKANDERITLVTEAFELLEGTWRIESDYGWESGGLLTLHGQEVALSRVAALAGLPAPLRGLAGTEFTARLPQPQIDALVIDGRWTVSGLSAQGIALGDGYGSISVVERRVTLDPMRMTHEEGTVNGSVWFDLDAPDLIHLDLSAEAWPTELLDPPLAMVFNGRAQGILDGTRLHTEASFDGTLDLTYDGCYLGCFELTGGMSRRTLTLEKIGGTLLGGQVTGEGALVLADPWLDSHANLRWEAVDLSQLNRLWDPSYTPTTTEPGAEPAESEPDDTTQEQPAPLLRGFSRGSMALGRATDPRAPEPMRMVLTADVANGFLGPMPLGVAEASAADANEDNEADAQAEADPSLPLVRATLHLGRGRAMFQPLTLSVSEGHLRGWGRVTMHDDELFTHGTVRLDNLNLDPIARLINLSKGPMPGRVAGELTLGGYLRQPHRAFGRANLTLRDSDIARAPGITQLFNALRLDVSGADPTGFGQAILRLESNALELIRLTYFNRGTDVVARMRIEDVRLGEQSPITGVAAGAIRPLKDAKLPFVGDTFDRLIQAAQTDTAAVLITGTLDEPITEVRPLAEITGTLGRLLRGSTE